MNLKSLLITTCLAAVTLVIQTPLHAQTATPSPTPDASGFHCEKGHGGHFGPKGHLGKRGEKGPRDPEKRLTYLTEKLGLSADQVVKIQAIFQSKTDHAEVKAAITAVLTPEQQTKWAAMKADRKSHKNA